MRIFPHQTIESVTEGHPDKICDQISDALLDAYLQQDPQSRVALETFGSHGLLIIGGEVSSRANVNAPEIARTVYRDIGYEDELEIQQNIVRQSPDIARGVDSGGAGDQGIMYGYATNETMEFLPPAFVLVRKITQGLTRLRRENPECSWLKPDGKAQVTLHNGNVETLVVSAQHEENIAQKEVEEKIRALLLEPILGPLLKNLERATLLINPAGPFTVGGFTADTGLTGRKIAVDSYGGLVPMGGGCFSGKDPTKVDRSGAYMARFVAKNLVANGYAEECLVGVAYAIGKAEPVMLFVEPFGGNAGLTDFVKERFDFRPQAIIERLALRKPRYRETARYGHFGNDGLPWEDIVKI